MARMQCLFLPDMVLKTLFQHRAFGSAHDNMLDTNQRYPRQKVANIPNKSHVVQQTNARKVLPAVVSVKKRR